MNPDIPNLRKLLELATEENIALRCLLGGGCDANHDGPHQTIAMSGKSQFCVECGEMLTNGKSKPWMDEDRLERAIVRLRARAALSETKADEGRG